MANKKINQLVLKTTIQSTDLFPLGDATTGQLYKKTIAELQAAIGGAVISVNGLVGTVVLDTDDIQELASPTNKYFTDARARAAISLTTTGNSGASTYSSSTGVLNVPTYTLAGLGGITAGFLSGGTGITYNSGTGVISYSGTVYTDASIRALLSGANGISYNSSTGQFTYSGTVYTDSSIRALLSGTAPITYNSSTGAIGITQATTSTDGYLSSTDWNTFNGKQSALTLGNFTEATSSVLTITGGTGAIIGSGLSVQVKLASGSQSGYLSSTDWTTFNSKQNALTNPVTGTSTSGYVTYWNGTSTISGDSAHFWDNTNKRLGIGTSSPNHPLTVKADTSANGINIVAESTGYAQLSFSNAGNTLIGNALTQVPNSTSYDMYLSTYNGSSRITRMVITGTGNVGIGTTSPVWLLEINKNSTSGTTGAYPAISVNNPNAAGYSGYYLYNGATQKAGFEYNNSANQLSIIANSATRMTFESELVSIYGTNNQTRFKLQNTDNSAYMSFTEQNMTMWRPDGSGSDYIIYTRILSGSFGGGGGIGLAPNNSMALFVTPGGQTLLGTTTNNGERLYVSGSIRATGSITANSDARLKKNIERIENALEKVGQISGYTYNTIYDEDRHAGVIAQEIDEVLPEIVNTGNDGLMGVEYGNLSALLIEAIKDLKKDNESLRAIVEGLRK